MDTYLRDSAGRPVYTDQYTLVSNTYATADWQSGTPTSTTAQSLGKTRTNALWVQDAWRFAPNFKLTLGGRQEQWRAYDGVNFLASPASNVNQASVSQSKFSPKAALAWDASKEWKLSASYGTAYRFPTVTELYQAVTVSGVVSTTNPNLKPERAYSSELVAEKNDAFVSGLDLAGNLTWVDSKIRSDPNFRNASGALTDVTGKYTPNIPRLKINTLATYRYEERCSGTVGTRYSDRVWATLDNTDVNPNTYQGFDKFFVADVRVRYQFAKQWSAAVGIDNLNNRRYFLFHPFPQRTLVAELKFAL